MYLYQEYHVPKYGVSLDIIHQMVKLIMYQIKRKFYIPSQEQSLLEKKSTILHFAWATSHTHSTH